MAVAAARRMTDRTCRVCGRSSPWIPVGPRALSDVLPGTGCVIRRNGHPAHPRAPRPPGRASIAGSRPCGLPAAAATPAISSGGAPAASALLPRRVRVGPRPCSNCGQLTATPARCRCPACYKYEQRTGRERPARVAGSAKDDRARLSSQHPPAGRPAGALAPPRPLSDVPNVLAAPRRRTPAAPAAGRRDPAAVLPLWAADCDAQARPLQALLHLLAAHRPRTPTAAVVTGLGPYGQGDSRLLGRGEERRHIAHSRRGNP